MLAAFRNREVLLVWCAYHYRYKPWLHAGAACACITAMDPGPCKGT
jgi:hypothetical protein